MHIQCPDQSCMYKLTDEKGPDRKDKMLLKQKSTLPIKTVLN